MRNPTAALLFVLAGCRLSLDATPDAGAAVSAECVAAQDHSDLAWLQENVFSANCTLGSCHGGTAPQADHLSLIDGNAHDALVGKPSVEQPSWTLVVPGDADHSYLMVAVGEVAGPLPKDGTMPFGLPTLCEDKIEALQRWITAGATQ